MTIDKYLEAKAAQISEDFKAAIERRGHNASGDLSASVTPIVERDIAKITMRVEALEYFNRLQYGTSPEQASAQQGFNKKIEKWVIDKKINVYHEIIAQSILAKGTIRYQDILYGQDPNADEVISDVVTDELILEIETELLDLYNANLRQSISAVL